MKRSIIGKIVVIFLAIIVFGGNTLFAQENRQWWNSLTPAWKKIFRDLELKGKDVEPTDEQLADIVKMQQINCSGNKEITSLKPLAQLKFLTKINCSGTNITSLDGIEGLTNLVDLICSNNDNINSLIPVSNLTNLVSINCGNTMVKSLAPLRGLTNLKKLDVHFCTVNNLIQIKDLKKLTDLNVSQNQSLYTIEGVDKLLNLINFDCSETNVDDLTPLQSLKYLESLHVSDTKVVTLRPLQGVRSLTEVDCSNTGISAASLDYFYAHFGLTMFRGRNLSNITQKQLDDFTASFSKKNPNCTLVLTID